jgi:hypothetical protein
MKKKSPPPAPVLPPRRGLPSGSSLPPLNGRTRVYHLQTGRRLGAARPDLPTADAAQNSVMAAIHAAKLEMEAHEKIGFRPRFVGTVEDETEKWGRLLAHIDYVGRRRISKHSLKTEPDWRLWDDEAEDFLHVPAWQIDDVLFELRFGAAPRFHDGRRIPDPEREWIKELFKRRHKDAHERGHLPAERRPLNQPQRLEPPEPDQMDFDL